MPDEHLRHTIQHLRAARGTLDPIAPRGYGSRPGGPIGPPVDRSPLAYLTEVGAVEEAVERILYRTEATPKLAVADELRVLRSRLQRAREHRFDFRVWSPFTPEDMPRVGSTDLATARAMDALDTALAELTR
jgi:hypothetical protein